jgi:hypothetical protein
MGSYYTYGATRKDIIAEVTKGWTREDGTGTQAIRHCARGNTLYVVHETTAADETYRFIGVYLLLKDREGWGYKPMDEAMGPYQFNCPVSYIELAEEKPKAGGLGKTSDEWRRRVRFDANLRARKFVVGQTVGSVRPLSYGGRNVERFVVISIPKGGRNLLCEDADGRVYGLLRLAKTDIL